MSERQMSWRLPAETVAYQVYVEAVRAHPDDEQLAGDLVKAKRSMEVAWLERVQERTDDG